MRRIAPAITLALSLWPAAHAGELRYDPAKLAAMVAPMSVPVAVPEPRTFALIVVGEDDFFDGRALTLADAASFVAKGMPERACIAASRLANQYQGMTACVAEPRR